MDVQNIIYLIKDISLSNGNKAKKIAEFAINQLDLIERGLLDYRIASASFCLIMNHLPNEVILETPLIKEVLADCMVLHYLGTDYSLGTENIKMLSQAILNDIAYPQLLNVANEPLSLRIIKCLEHKKDYFWLNFLAEYYFRDISDNLKEVISHTLIEAYRNNQDESKVLVVLNILLKSSQEQLQYWCLRQLEESADPKVIPVLQGIKNNNQEDKIFVERIENTIKFLRDKSEYTYWYDIMYDSVETN